MKLSDLSNFDDDAKQERIDKIVKHLSLVQLERSLYLYCIHKAKSDIINSIAHLSSTIPYKFFFLNPPD